MIRLVYTLCDTSHGDVEFLRQVPAAANRMVCSRRAELIVKPAQGAGPAEPLGISETADSVTVDAGVARFTVNKSTFNLLESVELAGRKVAGPGSVDIADSAGKPFKAGRPSKVSWEYRGPLRATLRVDGPYLDGEGQEFIAYTTRLSFWAGSGAVRVDHSLRNSNPKEGDDAKIKWATVSLGLEGLADDQGHGENWSAGSW